MLLKSASEVWLNANGLEPLRSNHFEITILNHRGDRMPDTGQYCIKDIPSLVDDVQVDNYVAVNSAFPIPGIKSSILGDLTFRASGDKRLLEWWLDWRNVVYNPEEDLVGLYRDVIGSGEIIVYGPADGCGPPKKIYSLELQGIWPRSVIHSPFSMDANGENLTFSVSMAMTDVSVRR